MINKHLKSLLADNKRVIIPDFGGFVVKRSAAGDIISFNSFLKFNDDLLADLFVEKEGVDKNQALKEIQSFVKLMNESLDSQGKYEIEGVGFLVKDKKGNIRFVDEIDEVVASVLPAEKEELQKEDVQQSKEDSVNDIEPEDITEEIVEDEALSVKEDAEKAAIEKKKKSRIWIVIIVILIAIGAWVISHHAFKHSDVAVNTELVEGASSSDGVSSQIAEQHNKLIEKKADERMNKELSSANKGFVARLVAFFKGLFSKTEIVESPKVEVKGMSDVSTVMLANQIDTISGILVVADKDISTKGNERYYVIVGSFSERVNANKFNRALVEDEYASEVFDRYNGFTAVSMGAYPSLDIALKVCGEELRKTPDSWILVK